MITELFPILTTSDMPRALGFYRDLLAGTVVYEFAGPNGEPAYVGLDIGASHVGIGLDSGNAAGTPPGASACGCTPMTATRWWSGCAPPV